MTKAERKERGAAERRAKYEQNMRRKREAEARAAAEAAKK